MFWLVAAASGWPTEEKGLREGPFLVVLGVAQDGGIPQAGSPPERWSDPAARRHVVSLGLVDPRDGRRYLFEATPDLPEQLLALDRLAPRRSDLPLDGVFLTHAHVGHYTGLLFLGHEVLGARGVPVWAAPRMRSYLESDGPWSQLVRYENIVLRDLPPGGTAELAPGLRVGAFRVPHREEYSEALGFRIDGPNHSALFIPDIDSWEDWDERGVRIEELLEAVDVAYLDATFWADGELGHRDMSAIPHPRIRDSMDRFQTLPAGERAKVRFIHLNHTNPARLPDSAERAEIERRGFRVAEEGERVEL